MDEQNQIPSPQDSASSNQFNPPPQQSVNKSFTPIIVITFGVLALLYSITNGYLWIKTTLRIAEIDPSNLGNVIPILTVSLVIFIIAILITLYGFHLRKKQTVGSISNKHKYGVFFLIIAIPILVIVYYTAGPLLLSLQNKGNQQKTQQPTVSLTPSPTPKPITGWKTYNDIFNEFTIQYPDTWKFTGVNKKFYTTVFYPPGSQTFSRELGNEYKSHIGIAVFENHEDLPLKEFITKRIIANDYIFQPISIDGVSGLRTQEITGDNVNNLERDFVNDDIFLKRGNLIYYIRHSEHKKNTIGKEDFEQILATFQFLKQIESNRSCDGKNNSFCTLANKVIQLMNENNISKLTDYQKAIPVSCTDKDEPFAEPCNGAAEGTTLQRYLVGWNQSEGDYFTKETLQKYLTDYISEKGNFKLNGLIYNGKNEGIIVYSSGENNNGSLFALHIANENDKSVIDYIVLGMSSSDYTQLSRDLLKEFYPEAQ